ncbi:MAG: HAD family phosphatase [Candidatus Lokiarchaeota archaeon]|nr:HAD family phosphatase [Candidatus Lokiarchaeota archaeon]
MKIKCIIIDLGDVLIELDFSRFFNEVITPSPFNKPQAPIMLEFFRQSDTYHQGKITDEEFYKQACEILGVCALDQKQFYAAFNSIINDLNVDMVELIKKIKKSNDLMLICMSNINASHWRYLKKQKWDIWQLFDEFILSHELQMAKPDPKMFELALEKSGCKPEEVLFIDDGLNNVRSAQNMGIHAIRFMGLENLIEELKKYNIKLS